MNITDFKSLFRGKKTIKTRNPNEMTMKEYIKFMEEKEIEIDLAVNKGNIKRINAICDEMQKITIID